MQSFKDTNIYLNRMAKTVSDKAWWVEYITNDVVTVYDFGCADAVLFLYLENLYPGRFRYVGIDNNKALRAKANDNIREFKNASIIDSIPSSIEKGSILILNSVMHEIIHYLTPIEKNSLISSFLELGFDYIAVRDMYNFVENNILLDNTITIPNSLMSLYTESKSRTSSKSEYESKLEFMLKYFYKENWERESREKYLHQWKSLLLANARYKIVKEENFAIPYLMTKWKEDEIGFPGNILTHKKILLKKNGME